MSIYVYITRRRNPIEDDSPDIRFDEWRSVASSDGSFRDVTPEELASVRELNSEHLIWLGHPAGLDAWFTWNNSQINIRNPDEALIAKAMQLAAKLSAQVISEMGEIYNEDGSHKGFVDGEPW